MDSTTKFKFAKMIKEEVRQYLVEVMNTQAPGPQAKPKRAGRINPWDRMQADGSQTPAATQDQIATVPPQLSQRRTAPASQTQPVSQSQIVGSDPVGQTTGQFNPDSTAGAKPSNKGQAGQAQPKSNRAAELKSVAKPHLQMLNWIEWIIDKTIHGEPEEKQSAQTMVSKLGALQGGKAYSKAINFFVEQGYIRKNSPEALYLLGALDLLSSGAAEKPTRTQRQQIRSIENTIDDIKNRASSDSLNEISEPITGRDQRRMQMYNRNIQNLEEMVGGFKIR